MSPYFRRINMANKGQALLELAVFGTILLMLLGILVNYSLRYNFQQQAMQQAFRKALKSAAESDQEGKPASTTHIIIKDKYIPNPSNPFGIGSVIPVSASASVVRNYHLQDNSPDTYAELPQITMDIQGQEVSFKTAGFRDEYNVEPNAINKYYEIYGYSNVWETGDGECLEEEIGFQTGEAECIRESKNIRIVDSSAGEVVNYDTAVRQCRQIVDRGACVSECVRGGKSAGDCDNICSYTMNVPWYCGEYTTDPNWQGEYRFSDGSVYPAYKYNFPKINDLFNFAIVDNKPKSMGLQQDYTQETRVDNTSLKKKETAAGIKTTDSLNYKDTMKRTVIYNVGLDEEGVSKEVVDVKPYPLNTTTQFVTCEQNSTDCIYGYKVVTYSEGGEEAEAGEKKWLTIW